MNKKQIYFAVILTILPWFMAGCSDELQILTSSPEEIAIHFVQENNEDGFSIEDNSVTIIQTIEGDGGAFILVQYDGERESVGPEKCQVVLEARHNPIAGWRIKNGSGLCHEFDDSTDTVPITIASSQGSLSIFQGRYSSVFGYVRDSQIVRVVVTWNDGQEQAVEVYLETYFLVRNDESHMARIAAYNAKNEIVFSENFATDPKNGN